MTCVASMRSTRPRCPSPISGFPPVCSCSLLGCEPRRSGRGLRGCRSGAAGAGERRREPAVFRARRAHARSRGPQVWIVPRRGDARERQKYIGRLNERRAVVGQPETPCPPAIRADPRTNGIRGGAASDQRPRALGGGAALSPSLPWLTVGALVAPRPARPVAGVCWAGSTTSRGYNGTMCVLATGVGRMSPRDQRRRHIATSDQAAEEGGRCRPFSGPRYEARRAGYVRIHRVKIQALAASGHVDGEAPGSRRGPLAFRHRTRRAPDIGLVMGRS
jgi:hypothetical protein